MKVNAVGPMKLIAARMGGWACWDQASTLLSETGIYIDTAFSLGVMTPAADQHEWKKEDLQLLNDVAFCELVCAFGARHVLFGTDSPWAEPEKELSKIVFSRSLTERARCVTILEWRRAVQPLNHRRRPGPSPAQPSTHRARPVKGGGQQTAEPPACSNTEHQAHRFTGVPEGILHTNSDLTDNGLGRHSLVCQANPAKRAGWLVGVDCLPRGSIVKRTVEYIYRHL
jgi:hypothetical protein